MTQENIMAQTILVTGGAGYIGSHTCVELAQAGFDLLIVDNLCNSKREAIARTERLAGKKIAFYEMDIRDRDGLRRLFSEHSISAVIHFAGLKAVGESVSEPLQYYETNVAGSLVLFDVMAAAGVRTLVFSSSATVYGDPQRVPVVEDAPLSATNPYGRTKLMVEEILGDIRRADNRWRIGLLRYFNPVGAHDSGLIGEDPNAPPNNLMPIVTQVAIGKRAVLPIFGNDYNTHDGTGVRDYIHVVDLAIGHVRALTRLLNHDGIFAINLGTGHGFSVLDLVKTFSKVSGRPIP